MYINFKLWGGYTEVYRMLADVEKYVNRNIYQSRYRILEDTDDIFNICKWMYFYLGDICNICK